MDPNDSKMIYRYLDKLIDETPDFEDILNALIKKKMFSPSMVSHIKSGETDRVRLTKLYEMVPKRGPEAFRNLISALEEVGCIELSQILSGKKIVVINSQRYLDTNKEEIYTMRSNPRGHVLLINNINFKNLTKRYGAFHDAPRLKELWNGLGYSTIMYFDLQKTVSVKVLRISQENVQDWI